MLGEEKKIEERRKDKTPGINGFVCLLKHETNMLERYYELMESYDEELIKQTMKVFIDEQLKRINTISKLIENDNE